MPHWSHPLPRVTIQVAEPAMWPIPPQPVERESWLAVRQLQRREEEPLAMDWEEEQRLAPPLDRRPGTEKVPSVAVRSLIVCPTRP